MGRGVRHEKYFVVQDGPGSISLWKWKIVTTVDDDTSRIISASSSFDVAINDENTAFSNFTDSNSKLNSQTYSKHSNIDFLWSPILQLSQDMTLIVIDNNYVSFL